MEGEELKPKVEKVESEGESRGEDEVKSENSDVIDTGYDPSKFNIKPGDSLEDLASTEKKENETKDTIPSSGEVNGNLRPNAPFDPKHFEARTTAPNETRTTFSPDKNEQLPNYFNQPASYAQEEIVYQSPQLPSSNEQTTGNYPPGFLPSDYNNPQGLMAMINSISEPQFAPGGYPPQPFPSDQFCILFHSLLTCF